MVIDTFSYIVTTSLNGEGGVGDRKLQSMEVSKMLIPQMGTGDRIHVSDVRLVV